MTLPSAEIALARETAWPARNPSADMPSASRQRNACRPALPVIAFPSAETSIATLPAPVPFNSPSERSPLDWFHRKAWQPVVCRRDGNCAQDAPATTEPSCDAAFAMLSLCPGSWPRFNAGMPVRHTVAVCSRKPLSDAPTTVLPLPETPLAVLWLYLGGRPDESITSTGASNSKPVCWVHRNAVWNRQKLVHASALVPTIVDPLASMPETRYL